MKTDREQFHQAQLAQSATAYNPRLSATVQNLAGRLGPAGLSAPDAMHQAYGRIYKGLQLQAQTLAYIDTFWVLAVMALCVIPFVFLLARPERGSAAVVH